MAQPGPQARLFGWLDKPGDQFLFHLRALLWIPKALLRYLHEVLRLLAQVAFGSGGLGVIGGTELPPVKSSFAAFAAGARAANPRVRVLSSFIGNWDDVSAGKEQALAQIGRGADVIFQNADAAGLGVFQAARERGVYAFGSNSNQNAVAPDVVLGSVVIDLPRAFLRVAREVKAGTFTGRVVTLGLDTKVVTYVPNPALAGKVPQAVVAAVDSAERAIEAGTLKPLPDAVRYGGEKLRSGVKVSEAKPGGGL